MAPRTTLAVPTRLSLPDQLRLPPNSAEAYKTLSKLSRPALISLALQWLKDAHHSRCAPYTTAAQPGDLDDEDALYDVAHDVQEIRDLYHDLSLRKGSKKEIVDRILEGDWRHGISLYQLATAETKYLLEHQTSQRWSALQLTAVAQKGQDAQEASAKAPRFHASTFVRNLKQELGSVAKAHYYLQRAEALACTIVRVQVYDSPYSSQKALRDLPVAGSAAPVYESSKAVFILFPDSTPYVFFSVSTAGLVLEDAQGKNIRQIIVTAVPKALSRPHARYTLQPTRLVSKSLPTLLALRGSKRSNNAAGGWSIFIDQAQGSSEPTRLEKKAASSEDDKENTPGGAKRHLSRLQDPDESTCKRFKALAEGRFGSSAQSVTQQPLERFDVKLVDPFPTSATPANAGEEDDGNSTLPDLENWKPEVRLSFQGASVFHGLRQLVEKGIVDGASMPGWMTGEAAVSWGIVRDGRLSGGERA